MATSPDHPEATQEPCPNCASPLRGEWCSGCGQKRIDPEERRLSWVVRDFAAKATSLDGKVLKSLLALVFQPGRLGADWLAGKRVRWMSPMALFLVINVIYFVAPPVTDFNLPLIEHLRGHPHSDWALDRIDDQVPGVAAWIESRGVNSRPDGYVPYALEFNQRTQSLSKVILILQVPLVAVVLMLLHWRRRIYLVDHFWLALHFWTFVLLAIVAANAILGVITRWLTKMGWAKSEDDIIMAWELGFLALLVAHLVLMLRRAYGQSLPLAMVKALPVLVACVVSHVLFRTMLFAITYLTL